MVSSQKQHNQWLKFYMEARGNSMWGKLNYLSVEGEFCILSLEQNFGYGGKTFLHVVTTPLLKRCILALFLGLAASF